MRKRMRSHNASGSKGLAMASVLKARILNAYPSAIPRPTLLEPLIVDGRWWSLLLSLQPFSALGWPLRAANHFSTARFAPTPAPSMAPAIITLVN